jgi:hypothetical protein
MKRLLLIGFAACTFALAPIPYASAMPIAHPNALTGVGISTIQVHGWGHHRGWHRGWHHGWGYRHWGHRRGWGHRRWA